MRRLGAALLISGATLVPVSTAGAQEMIFVGAPIHAGAAGTPYSSPFIAPYSYYAARSGPARIYVGYGNNDFPFNGRPYGNPTDPWSWQYMSGSYVRDLSRYYYPPLR